MTDGEIERIEGNAMYHGGDEDPDQTVEIAPHEFRGLCAQARLANRYPQLPVEPPGCPTPGACSAVKYLAAAEKRLPNEPKWTTPVQEAPVQVVEYIKALHTHALSLAAKYGSAIEDGLRKSKMYNEVCEERDELAAQLAEVKGDAERWKWARPILCGDDDALANGRAMALALGLANNRTPEQIIDTALSQLAAREGGMRCRLCGKHATEIGGWLERVNEKGVPGVWECRPMCGANLLQSERVMGAIEGTLPNAAREEGNER